MAVAMFGWHRADTMGKPLAQSFISAYYWIEEKLGLLSLATGT